MSDLTKGVEDLGVAPVVDLGVMTYMALRQTQCSGR